MNKQLLARLGFDDCIIGAPVIQDAIVSLDIGCGYVDELLQPVYAKISLDLNMRLIQRSLLKKLRSQDSHPIGADAHHLPIRDSCVSQIYLRNILEHLEDPDMALREGKRVLVLGGLATVTLPIITNLIHLYLAELFLGFPFSVPSLVLALWRAHLYWSQPGYYHKHEIHSSYIRAHFEIIYTNEVYESHKWFRGPWRAATERLTNGRLVPNIQGLYLIICKKEDD